MNTLHLTLEKKWFDMIDQDIKPEEYRKIKPYWIKRLIRNNCEMEWDVFDEMCDDLRNPTLRHSSVEELLEFFQCEFKHFDNVVFSNGYGNNAPKVTRICIDITIGIGNKDWGAPDEPVFIIKLKKQ